MTEYYVFKHGGGDPNLTGECWDIVGNVNARSAQSAVNAVLTAPDVPGDLAEHRGGLYAAVPARSWKPVTVKVETKTALRFS